MPDYQRQATPEQDQSNFDPLTMAAGAAMGGMMGGPLGALGGMGMAGLMGNSAVSGMLSSGVDAAGGLLGDAAGWLGEKAGQLGDWAGGAWDSAKEMGSNAWNSASEWVGNKVDGIKQFGGDLINGVSQEGLGGLLDPVGMMDRQAAQRELADRFQVVGDDFVGPRLPNQVSQAEYERICGMYSDIRLGRGDLTIDPSALGTPEEQQAYRDGAMGDIANMLQTQNGRDLITRMHNNTPQTDAAGNPVHRHTTMVPLLAADGTRDLTNGYAAPDGPGSTRTVNADGTLGAAGAGTDVHIRYNPGVNIGDAYPQLTTGGNNPWLGDFRSDVLLMHEMNHAMHQTAGTGDPTQVTATDNPLNATDPEMANDAGIRRIEHQAVGLGRYANDPMTENAYRAERRLVAASGTGARAGDATMNQRTSYIPHNPPAAAAPGAGTPGLPAFIHGPGDDHDHDHDHH